MSEETKKTAPAQEAGAARNRSRGNGRTRRQHPNRKLLPRER